MEVCVIIDAYSTGNQLAKYFKENKYEVIHVQSSEYPPKILSNSFRVEDFSTNVIYDGNLEKILNTLSEYNPKIILTGSETGVELADILANHFNLLNNVFELSSSRRNKYIMIESVKNAGLKVSNQIKTSFFNELVSWVEKHNKWPIVIKPLDSAASDNVRICANLREVEQAFNNIIGEENSLGLLNKEVLAQEYITGEQYMVNAVSIDGEHYITDLWFEGLYEINNSSIIYDKWTLLDRKDPIYEDLIAYTKNVLTSLGIEYGATHSEVRLTNEGPTIIETGARTMGLSFDEEIFKNVLGYSQAELTAYSYIDKQLFLKKYNALPENSGCLQITFFRSQEDSILNNKIQEFKNFNTVKKINLINQPGDLIKKTIEPMMHPGWLYQLSNTYEEIDKEYILIREAEDNGTIYSKLVQYNQI
ncbi:ATP-grasp domain-containing protein [Lysinibacillus sp. NPDC097214]|uniref:ATP-grasp domain-containing protein n=1 Tax=Lysinibacillus sp. NPDC097214 TaxID=3390584 RepID=UPI003CFF45F2